MGKVTTERFTKILNFIPPPPPGAGVLKKMYYFFKILLLYSQAKIRQTKYVEMMTTERSTKILNFMTPGVGVLVLGCGHIRQIVKMHYFF